MRLVALCAALLLCGCNTPGPDEATISGAMNNFMDQCEHDGYNTTQCGVLMNKALPPPVDPLVLELEQP